MCVDVRTKGFNDANMEFKPIGLGVLMCKVRKKFKNWFSDLEEAENSSFLCLFALSGLQPIDDTQPLCMSVYI
jgi:hypothetical protein